MNGELDHDLDEVHGGVAWKLVLWLGPLLLVVALAVGFELVYADRVLPGVSADGVYLAGLNTSNATATLQTAATGYQSAVIAVNDPSASNSLKLTDLKPAYTSTATVAAAMSYGRRGSLWQRLTEQGRAFFGRKTTFAGYTYDDTTVQSLVSGLVDRLSTPVSNATFAASGTALSITPSTLGTRVDTGQLIAILDDRLATMSASPITVPTYQVTAAVDAAALEKLRPQAETYLAAPVTVTVMGQTQDITPATIASWLDSSGHAPATTLIPTYPLPNEVTMSLDRAAVAAYVSNMAKTIDQPAIDGQLTVDDSGTPTIAVAGQDGRTVDQTGAIAAIMKAVAAPTSNRSVTVAVAVVKPAVSQDTLASLGITQLLSEGESFFAGSDANRNTNIRVGASKFNGVLIKPGGTFSFNTLLGEIGPEYGYAPGYVILGNKEEKQYGGGLCQVATTAYRAALMAGLPITQRTNHSFAVSWYTKPYGVPGVDATIYPPDPDLKFVNDTPGYILIQTHMVGYTLKFDFYGTKVKSGQIRGPYFVSGSLDPTKPSHTVFYRDILDLAGNVTHTDTVNTYYQSSLNFPID